jgi:hypothetical protein
MVHIVTVGNAGHAVREVVVDGLFTRSGGLLGPGARGRGAHLHPRLACLARASAGLSRAFRAPVSARPAELGAAIVAACERRMEGLLLSARRIGAVAAGADAALAAARRGAPLLVVAVDAGAIAEKTEVAEAVAAGRAVAWRTKADLGRLLGETAVALCAVDHGAIAAELKKVRAAAADAGAAAQTTNSDDVASAELAELREGARCRRPEAR